MKTLYTQLCFVFGLIAFVYAQTPPQAFKYQAVCRDANGNPLINQAVNFKIGIIQGSITGTLVYSEYQLDTTNAYGVSNLEIGRGQAISGNFGAINWGNGPHFITLSFDPAGGTAFVPLGTQELLSVPYALYAGSSNTPGPQGPQGPQGVSITNSWVQGDSLYVALSNSQTLNTGHVRGATGAQGVQGPAGGNGPQGVSVLNSWVMGDSLYVALSNSQTLNTGHVRGPAGPGFNNGTAQNQILYWNGSAWVTLNPGIHEQVLTLCNGALTWTIGGVCPWRVGMVHCGAPTAIVPVTNPTTNKTWMDRNLGASQVATSSTDANAYGDLYQWGRFADGHQCRNSGTTTTLSPTDTPGHGNFILSPNAPNDWRTPQNNTLWQGVNGINNPCPVGYRIPTDAEWDAERLSWVSSDDAGAFASFLKLPVAGNRNHNGLITSLGYGFCWASTITGNNARSIHYYTGVAGGANDNRGYGFSVRCIQN